MKETQEDNKKKLKKKYNNKWLDYVMVDEKGDLIKHKIFGIGRVIEVTKIKNEFKLKINFGGNIKDIMSSFVEKVI